MEQRKSKRKTGPKRAQDSPGRPEMKRKRKWTNKRNKGKRKEKQDQRGRSRGLKGAKNEREMEGIDVASMWHRRGSMLHR